MKHLNRPIPSRNQVRGMTLVELMVAITIGMLIIAAMAILFANNSRSLAETERSGQKIENGRYALEVVSDDLHHAGYFQVFDPRQLPVPAALPDACATSPVALRAAIPVHVQGYDNATSATLACISGAKPGTDIVVVRRASGCAIGSAGCTALPAGAPAFQASTCNDATELGSGDVNNFHRLDTDAAAFTLTRRDCATVAERRRYIVRIYFVAANDVGTDGIPTLKRAELGATGFTTTSLVQGVEDLQVQYGMDSNADGNADVYSASPEGYQNCNPSTTPTCVARWTSVVSAKVYVLSRNLAPTPGHVDAKRYVLGQVADVITGSGANKVVGPFNDGYKRSVFQELVRLQNPSGRSFTP